MSEKEGTGRRTGKSRFEEGVKEKGVGLTSFVVVQSPCCTPLPLLPSLHHLHHYACVVSVCMRGIILSAYCRCVALF